jgi:hypothetical protein
MADEPLYPEEPAHLALVRLALDAYYDAAMRGLCHDGAREAAINAVRGAASALDRSAFRSVEAVVAEHLDLARRAATPPTPP